MGKKTIHWKDKTKSAGANLMPFNGGGGGTLPPHKHTNIANDGSPLDFGNVTVGSMNAGDLTYSNGAALQQLAIGAPNDQLRVSAGNIPEWATPTSSATFELVDDQELSGTATFIDSTFASLTGDDVSQLQVVLDLQRSNVGVCDILLQYGSGGLVTSAYYTSMIGTSIASLFYNNQAEWLLARNPNYRHLMTNAFISLPSTNMTTFNADMVLFSNSAGTDPEGYIVGATRDGTGVSGVDQIRVSVSAGNLEQGSKMSIFKLNR